MSIKTKKKRHARYKGVRLEKDAKGYKFETEGSDEPVLIVRLNEEAYDNVEAGKHKVLYCSFEEGMSSLVRLLIKMGLEIISTSKKVDVYDPIFDKAREAARNPKKSTVWKIAQTTLPSESCWESGVDDKGHYVRETQYKYGVYGCRGQDNILFFFKYWVFIFMISLTEGINFKTEIDRINNDNPSVMPLTFDTVKLA